MASTALISPAYDFKCLLARDDSKKDILKYSFKIPEILNITNYSLEYAISNNLCFQNKTWNQLIFGELSSDKRELEEEIYDERILINNKFALLRLKLVSEDAESDYVYHSLPRYFPYQSQLVGNAGAVPCITRTYKNNEWRQCRIQYYALHPLVAKPYIEEPDIDETIYDIYNRPVYVAKKET